MTSWIDEKYTSNILEKPVKVNIDDKMQKTTYYRTRIEGNLKDLPGFKPFNSPAQMLALGVFEGKYCRDCIKEFPESLFEHAKLADGKDADVSKNYFKVKSRLSLQQWKKNGWIPFIKGDIDIRGWFQWFLRTWYGRRDPLVDRLQIARWRSFVRHSGAVKKNCKHDKLKNGTCSKPMECRISQRQALLQWSHDPLI